MYEKNKSMLRKSDMVLIINLDQSPNMTSFEKYAKEQDPTNELFCILFIRCHIWILILYKIKYTVLN